MSVAKALRKASRVYHDMWGWAILAYAIPLFLLLLTLFQRYIMKRPYIFTSESFLSAIAVLLTLYVVQFMRQQAQMTFLQMEQAEELANRKDEALIEAIESLRTDLKRLPSPPTMNLALFNLPEKRGEDH